MTVTEQGPDWLRYRATDLRTVNPIVFRRLAERGIDVITLSEVPQSLETVYLQIVTEDEVRTNEHSE